MTNRSRSAIAAGALMLAGLGGAVAAPSLAGLAPRAASADTLAASSTQNSVSVNASGFVQVAPDMATVTVGVLVNRDNAQDAQTAANVVISNAVSRLHALGISNRYIQTAGISLQPRTDNSGNVIGYQATQDLAITVLNVHQIGPVIDAGVAAHANNDISINYGLRDQNAARNEALQRAVRNARARAQSGALALGLSLAGAHVQLSENSSQPMPQPVQFAPQRGAANSSTATQSYGGLLTVEEDVTLTYTF